MIRILLQICVHISIATCGRGVEYTSLFSVCRMRRLNRCPDGGASTAWDYAGLLCKFYRDAGQNAAKLLKPLVLNPHLTPFTHGATCC